MAPPLGVPKVKEKPLPPVPVVGVEGWLAAGAPKPPPPEDPKGADVGVLAVAVLPPLGAPKVKGFVVGAGEPKEKPPADVGAGDGEPKNPLVAVDVAPGVGPEVAGAVEAWRPAPKGACETGESSIMSWLALPSCARLAVLACGVPKVKAGFAAAPVPDGVAGAGAGWKVKPLPPAAGLLCSAGLNENPPPLLVAAPLGFASASFLGAPKVKPVEALPELLAGVALGVLSASALGVPNEKPPEVAFDVEDEGCPKVNPEPAAEPEVFEVFGEGLPKLNGAVVVPAELEAGDCGAGVEIFSPADAAAEF